ncbi:MAG: hypothetical protein V4581_17735 [Bacteroidota bacterium]
MTRTQFLLLLYKKLFRPALLLLVAWYGIHFIIALENNEQASLDIMIAVAFMAILYVLEHGLDYLITKFPSQQVTVQESKASKIFSRITDIALGMVILYVWKENSTAAIAMIISLVYGMIRDYKQKGQ